MVLSKICDVAEITTTITLVAEMADVQELAKIMENKVFFHKEKKASVVWYLDTGASNHMYGNRT